MQIYWNKRKRLHKKRVQLPHDWFGIPTWPPFHCFGTPIWPPWRHVKTLHTSIVWTHPDSNAMLCNEFLGTTLSMICSGGHLRTAPTTTSTGTWKKDIGQCDLYSYHLKYDHLIKSKSPGSEPESARSAFNWDMNWVIPFSLFYGLLSGLGSLLRMFCFLCGFTSAVSNKLLHYTGVEPYNIDRPTNYKVRSENALL